MIWLYIVPWLNSCIYYHSTLLSLIWYTYIIPCMIWVSHICYIYGWLKYIIYMADSYVLNTWLTIYDWLIGSWVTAQYILISLVWCETAIYIICMGDLYVLHIWVTHIYYIYGWLIYIIYMADSYLLYSWLYMADWYHTSKCSPLTYQR